MNLLLILLAIALFVGALLPRPPAAGQPIYVALQPPEETTRGAGCLLLCAFALAFLAVLVFA